MNEPGSDEYDDFGRLLTLDDVEERYIRKVLQLERGKNKGELCDILGYPVRLSNGSWKNTGFLRA
jgi:two-component system response regulator AtoC